MSGPAAQSIFTKIVMLYGLDSTFAKADAGERALLESITILEAHQLALRLASRDPVEVTAAQIARELPLVRAQRLDRDRMISLIRLDAPEEEMRRLFRLNRRHYQKMRRDYPPATKMPRTLTSAQSAIVRRCFSSLPPNQFPSAQAYLRLAKEAQCSVRAIYHELRKNRFAGGCHRTGSRQPPKGARH